MTKKANTPGEYEVGFARPPKQAQFKKGQPSANPKGRPKKPKGDFADIIKKVMSEEVTINDNGKLVKMPNREVTIRQLVRRGQGGHYPSAKEAVRLGQTFDVNPRRPPEESEEDKAARAAVQRKHHGFMASYASMKKTLGYIQARLVATEKKLAELEGREPDPDILKARPR